MKKISKEDFNGNLIKGLIAKFIFTVFYVFVYSLLLGSTRPLAFIADKGLTYTYIIIAMLISALPFIFCGYLIMLGRNRKVDLEQKNLVLALSIFVIAFIFYLGVTIFQLIFTYRNIYDIFILFNYPLLRATLFLELSQLELNMMMLLSTVIPALFVYLGGKLRLLALQKGH